MVHHEERRKVRTSSKHQQHQQQQQHQHHHQQHQPQQPYYHDERTSRRKKKIISKKKAYEASYDEEDDEALFSSPIYRDELDSSFPPPRLSDFDEMFQRAASNRTRRKKTVHDPEDLLEMDPPLGKPGEQYYLDLAGNIRKVFDMILIGNGSPFLLYSQFGTLDEFKTESFRKIFRKLFKYKCNKTQK